MTTAPPDEYRATLMCSCCNLPFAYVQRGVLVIHSRHGGEKHVNVVRLEEVQRLLDEATRQTNESRHAPVDVLP